jgi:hypothetical protein
VVGEAVAVAAATKPNPKVVVAAALRLMLREVPRQQPLKAEADLQRTMARSSTSMSTMTISLFRAIRIRGSLDGHPAVDWQCATTECD